jgi:trehalose 6-phosphate phosphatase
VSPDSNADRVEGTDLIGARRLTTAGSSALELLAEDPLHSGLCCDFDGTIAPIVIDPEAARPLAAALDALHALAREMAVVAVVSGRPAMFLADRLDLASKRSPLRGIGLHGLEEWADDGTVRLRAGVAAWRPVIESVRDQLRAAIPVGARVEDKIFGVTVHWRSAGEEGIDSTEVATRATEAARAVAAEHGLVPRLGKASVELVLPLGIDKGSVVTELCGHLQAAAYIGDDTGDLLGFRALDEQRDLHGLRSVKIAISSPEMPWGMAEAADLVLAGPSAAATFLAQLASCLAPS